MLAQYFGKEYLFVLIATYTRMENSFANHFKLNFLLNNLDGYSGPKKSVYGALFINRPIRVNIYTSGKKIGKFCSQKKSRGRYFYAERLFLGNSGKNHV